MNDAVAASAVLGGVHRFTCNRRTATGQIALIFISFPSLGRSPLSVASLFVFSVNGIYQNYVVLKACCHALLYFSMNALILLDLLL